MPLKPPVAQRAGGISMLLVWLEKVGLSPLNYVLFCARGLSCLFRCGFQFRHAQGRGQAAPGVVFLFCSCQWGGPSCFCFVLIWRIGRACVLFCSERVFLIILYRSQSSRGGWGGLVSFVHPSCFLSSHFSYFILFLFAVEPAQKRQTV